MRPRKRFINRLKHILPLMALVLVAHQSVAAETHAAPLEPPQAALLKKVGFDQLLNNQVPIDARFTDDRGRSVTLAECMSGRPTVFVLAYYRCPMLCNQVLNGVGRTLQALDFKPGKDFEVVVVSFDPTDTVEIAAAKKESVVHAFSHKADGNGWHFLIGDEKSVVAVANSVGFRYQYDPATNQYAHASGITLLTPDGRVSRYFYGIDYPTRDVRLGLVEASEGHIGSRVDELLLYCFHYDPLTGRYGLAIMRLIRTAGVATVAAIVGFIGISLRRERRQRITNLRSGSLPRVARAGEGVEAGTRLLSPLPSPPHQGEGTGTFYT